MQKNLRFLAVAATTSLLVGAAVFLTVRYLNGPPQEQPSEVAPADRKDILLTMPTLDHRTWSLSDHAGQIVLVNYFATWCLPCRAELPDLEQLAHEFKDLNIVLISVDKDEPGARSREEALNDFNDDEKLPFPILLPPLNSDLFQMEFPIPQTLILDRKGRVALHLAGPINPANLRPILQALLKEQ